MNEPRLKLTAYFGERQRAVHAAAGREFLADALLNLFGDREVATSVLLRGIASFGPHHVLRTDESLTLSEDPPVVVAAVDAESKINGLVDDVLSVTGRGLVTLVRAQQARDDVVVAAADHSDAVKLTVYVGRQDRMAGRPAYRAVCDLLHRHEFAGATVFLGVDGTARGQRCRAHFFSRNVNVPVMIISIGTAAQVRAAAAELSAAMPDPLLTVERVRVCKRDGELLARPHSLPTTDGQGRPLWQKVMVHSSEATGHNGAPIHRALVRRLLQSGTARGATVLRGVWGFHGDHEPHGDKFFRLARGVPVVTIIVDTPDSMAHTFDVVHQLTAEHGLVTCEMVPAVVSLDGSDRRGDTPLAQHDY
jgi:PII-like signaling protein